MRPSGRGVSVIIVAGGSGSRIGSELPKQFLSIKGKPVLYYTIQAFKSALPESEIILVLPSSHRPTWNRLILEFPEMEVSKIADSGSERFHSVSNGLRLISPSAEIIAIHDGVRPFVPGKVIYATIELAQRKGAAIPVIPVSDSIREIGEGEWSKAIFRERLRAVQTPQCFRKDWVMEAYNQMFEKSFTDDASVVESAGFEVFLAEGDSTNIKITTPFDLIIAEKMLELRGGQTRT